MIITTNHKVAIRELSKLLEVTKDKKNIRQVAQFLARIDPGNQIAINYLTNLLETNVEKEKDAIDLLNAKFLGTIDPDNQIAINYLTNLLNYSNREAIFASGYLDEIDPGNKLVVQFLIELFKSLKSPTDEKLSTDFDYILTEFVNHKNLNLFSLIDYDFILPDVNVTLERLSTINKLLIINVLIKKLEIHKNNGIICYCISYFLLDSLSEVTYGNQQVIEILTKLIITTKGLFSQMSLAFCLGKIDTHNQLAIKTLIDLLEKIKQKKYHNIKYHKEFCLIISDILLEINPGNKQALNEIFWNYDLIRFTQKKENNKSFDHSSEIIWKTSQIVSYPDFFQIYFYNGNLFVLYAIKEATVEIIYGILHNFYNFANAVITTLKKWLRIF